MPTPKTAAADPKKAATTPEPDSAPTKEAAPDKTKASEGTDKTEPDLSGARAFLNREFPSVKFEPPKGDDKAKEDEPSPDDGGDKGKDKKADKKTAAADKKPNDDKAAATDKTVDKTKPAPKPKQTPAAKAPAPLTADQIAEAAARGAAKGFTESKAASPDDKAKAPEAALDPADRRRVEVLRHLETSHPERYKGIAERFVQSQLALDAYAKQWEAAHPGQEFEEESPEHEDFFKKNDVDWDDGDFDDAAVDMRVQRALESNQGKTSEELQELKRKVQLQESGMAIGTHQTTAAIQFWDKLGDDFKDIVAPDGQVNKAKLQEMQKADPEGTATRIQAAKALDTEIAEIYKLYNGLVTFQPTTNPVHRSIAAFGSEMEEAILQQPVEDRLNDHGQEFKPSADYMRLTPEQRSKYWTFSAEDLMTMRSAKLAKLVSESVEAADAAHRRWAEARGLKVADKPAGASAPSDDAPSSDDDDEPRDKPNGPSSAGESRGAATKAGKGDTIPSGVRINALL